MCMVRYFTKHLLIVLGTLLIPMSAFSESQDTDRHIIFLVDFSGSVKQNIDNYWKTIETVTGCSQDMNKKDISICNMIQAKDRIVIIPITGQSKTNTKIISDVYIPKKGLIDSKSKYRLQTVPVKKKFRNDIIEAFSEPILANNTEILSAIEVAEHLFKGIEAKRKILVILSDMIEESEYYNFKENTVYSQQIIEKERSAGRMPVLDGVKVYVSGASAETDKKFDEVREFWMSYFEKTGASLPEHNYCSSELLSFDE